MASATSKALSNPTLTTYPETPDKNPPLITLELNSTIDFVITVEKPASWYVNSTVYGSLRSVGYVIEGTNVTVANSEKGNHPGFLPGTRNATFTGKLTGLTEGKHSIQIWANSVTFYHPEDTPQNFYGWWAVSAEYPIEAQSAVLNFSVNGSLISTTFLNFGIVLAVITGLVVAVLVYLKKRKRQPSAL